MFDYTENMRLDLNSDSADESSDRLCDLLGPLRGRLDLQSKIIGFRADRAKLQNILPALLTVCTQHHADRRRG
jgi:hypothetical protein